MKLYHGSTVVIHSPDISHSRAYLDFGAGFQTTSHLDQAIRWSQRKAFREGGVPIVNEYELSNDLSDIRVLRFGPADDEDQVNFVCSCRRGGTEYLAYDLIIGGVADDRVILAVDMYMQGVWDMPTTLSALKYYGKNDQYCFTSQKAINGLLKFIGSSEVHGER